MEGSTGQSLSLGAAGPERSPHPRGGRSVAWLARAFAKGRCYVPWQALAP